MKLRRSSIASILLVLAVCALAQGQRGRQFNGRMPANNTPPNAEFVLARWHYTAGCCGGGGWGHDYPVAEEHILQIMSETTGLDTSQLAYRIVELSSPEIFKYPFAYVSEPGEMSLSDEEVENLHEYIERGGFVMFDDFGGQADQQEFQRFKPNVDRAFPDREMYVLTGNHPMLHNFFDVDGLLMEHPMTQVKSIFYGLDDSKGRLAMIICFNNDVGDYWEFIDRPQYKIKPSAEALKLGINSVMYTMTH